MAIEDAIEKDGYTVIEKEMESGKYQFIAENDKTGFKSTFTYDSSDKTGVILQPTTREEARKIYSRWEGTAGKTSAISPVWALISLLITTELSTSREMSM